MTRSIDSDQIITAVARLCREANLCLPPDVEAALAGLEQSETAPLNRMAVAAFAENRRVAAAEQLPLCQDTGSAVFFVELGQEASIRGCLLEEAIQAGVASGYTEGYLRKSIVTPLDRVNTGDNTPAIIHTRLVAGDRLTISLMPKGGGAENMSRLAMLKPAAGVDGVRDFVVESVRLAGPNPCPPVIVGVGIGGNFETAPLLAKHSLLRPIGSPNPDPALNRLEEEWLAAVNGLHIGVQGFGGPNTALAVFIETMPCHFASLPAAVNLNCHVARHQQVIL